MDTSPTDSTPDAALTRAGYRILRHLGGGRYRAVAEADANSDPQAGEAVLLAVVSVPDALRIVTRSAEVEEANAPGACVRDVHGLDAERWVLVFDELDFPARTGGEDRLSGAERAEAWECARAVVAALHRSGRVHGRLTARRLGRTAAGAWQCGGIGSAVSADRRGMARDRAALDDLAAEWGASAASTAAFVEAEGAVGEHDGAAAAEVRASLRGAGAGILPRAGQLLRRRARREPEGPGASVEERPPSGRGSVSASRSEPAPRSAVRRAPRARAGSPRDESVSRGGAARSAPRAHARWSPRPSSAAGECEPAPTRRSARGEGERRRLPSRFRQGWADRGAVRHRPRDEALTRAGEISASPGARLGVQPRRRPTRRGPGPVVLGIWLAAGAGGAVLGWELIAPGTALGG